MAVRRTMTPIATSRWGVRAKGPRRAQGASEIPGAKTARNLANAAATAAIVPVWMTSSMAQPKRKPASGP